MSPLVGVLVLILLGLLGSRFAFNPSRTALGPRLLFATGTHFLLLGLLLGPVFGLLTPVVVGQLQPLMALGLGWIGLLFGLQLDRTQLGKFPSSYLIFTVVQALITFALFAGAGFLVFGIIGELRSGVDVALLATAATAAVSAPAGIALIGRTFRVDGELTRFLFYVASLDAVVGIVALQLTYSVFHPMSTPVAAGFSWVVWLVAATAAGVIFAIFFLWLTRPKPEGDELTLFLLGLVVFEAGTALYLAVSPLYVCMITGAVIGNLSPLRRRVYAMLQQWEKAVFVILLILAGSLLGASSWLALPLGVAYLLVRGSAKYAAGWAARAAIPLPFRPPGAAGLGLLPQGGISIAMALSAALTYRTITGPEWEPVGVAFGTIVVAVAASELVGPFLTRDLLRRAGEITPEMERNLAEARQP